MRKALGFFLKYANFFNLLIDKPYKGRAMLKITHLI